MSLSEKCCDHCNFLQYTIIDFSEGSKSIQKTPYTMGKEY